MKGDDTSKKKLKYFYENDIEVHITKTDGFFLNGKILEMAGDMIVFDDDVLGGMPIYILEIERVEKRRHRGDDGKKC